MRRKFRLAYSTIISRRSCKTKFVRLKPALFFPETQSFNFKVASLLDRSSASALRVSNMPSETRLIRSFELSCNAIREFTSERSPLISEMEFFYFSICPSSRSACGNFLKSSCANSVLIEVTRSLCSETNKTIFSLSILPEMRSESARAYFL